MKMLTGAFILWAMVLVLSSLAFLLPPLLRRRSKVWTDSDQDSVNVSVLRDDMVELEREHDEGLLGDADFVEAKEELKRRLLEESESLGGMVATEAQSEAPSGAAKVAEALKAAKMAAASKSIVASKPAAASPPLDARPSVVTAGVLIVLLPMIAFLFYLRIGEPAALDPAVRQPRAEVTEQQIYQMVSTLEERLKANPDDLQGWVMLARSRRALGEYQASAEAFAKAGSAIEGNADLLADYAEVLYLSGDGIWSEKALGLLHQALTLDPEQPQALLFAGSAARDRGDLEEAAKYWRRLQALAEPGSEEAEALQKAIDQALATPKQD